MRKHTWTLCAAALIAAAVGMNGEADYEPPKPGTYQLPVIKSAADGEVLDVQGNATRLGAYVHGKVTVLSFIYSRCGDAKACPFATGVLRTLHEVSEDDATLAKGMRLVSLSFDPTTDTPEKMRSYAEVAASEKPAAEWHFLTTKSEEKLGPILEAYGQSVARKENPNDPTGPLNHNLRVILIDAAGKVRNIYSSGTLDERLVLADVRTLLMQTNAESGEEVSLREAAKRPGQTCTVTFKIGTAVRVTDITEKENHRPLEVLLVDTHNDDPEVDPVDRAGIVVSVPVELARQFGAADLDSLGRHFEDTTVSVTGKVTVEPHPRQRDGEGKNRPRARIAVCDPAQVRIHRVP